MPSSVNACFNYDRHDVHAYVCVCVLGLLILKKKNVVNVVRADACVSHGCIYLFIYFSIYLLGYFIYLFARFYVATLRAICCQIISNQQLAIRVCDFTHPPHSSLQAGSRVK